ncbi:MAG: glycerophosphodiester phosphodiesterase [Halioglobus sp.]
MAKQQPIVIAHRGASGYLPEHSLASKAVAHAMGADYLEQDVVLSKDGVPVVLHDIHLESTTDVAQKYPKRARKDGRFYAIDFDLDELHSLRLHERSRTDANGNEIAVYPSRFPLQETSFQIPTLAQEIALIQGLDESTGKKTGIYVELKSPQWHTNEGLDIAVAVLEDLENSGYAGRTDQVYLQCFDDKTLRRLRNDLNTPLPLIQLIGENAWGEDGAVDYTAMRSPTGLAEVATYAQGIGPWLHQIYEGKTKEGVPIISDLVADAHSHNLLVHPYTFRKDELPKGITRFDELLELFLVTAGVDGLFTDFPDLAVNYINSL